VINDSEVWGRRPVGIAVDKDGALLVSEMPAVPYGGLPILVPPSGRTKSRRTEPSERARRLAAGTPGPGGIQTWHFSQATYCRIEILTVAPSRLPCAGTRCMTPLKAHRTPSSPPISRRASTPCRSGDSPVGDRRARHHLDSRRSRGDAGRRAVRRAQAELGLGVEQCAGRPCRQLLPRRCRARRGLLRLADRSLRPQKLFTITLAIYLLATAATGLSWDSWSFGCFRFLTGAGIGGEYTAINSTIQELIPARFRGWTDLLINGSFWLGAAMGAGGSLVLLDPAFIDPAIGWRLAFLIGATIGLVILVMRL